MLTGVIPDQALEPFAGQYPDNLDIIHQALSHPNMPRPVMDQTRGTYIAELLTSAERGETESVETVLTQVVERELYGQAIRLARGDQSKAARWLGVSRPTMREKLIRYGLHPTQALFDNAATDKHHT